MSQTMVDSFNPFTVLGERPMLFGNGPFTPSLAATWASSVPGWMTVPELTWIAEKASQLCRGDTWGEVGTWKGRSVSAVFLAVPLGVKVLAIDHWQGSAAERDTNHQDHATSYEEFRATRRSLVSIRPTGHLWEIPSASPGAAASFKDESFAVVFIDGSHEEKDVAADLKAWWPKVRPGGMLCGHDGGYAPVRRAYREVFEEPISIEVDSIWAKVKG